MKRYKAGQKSQAICPNCVAMVPTTYAYRDRTFDGGQVHVPELLVQVCDQCDASVAIPAQSMPAIKRAKAAASYAPAPSADSPPRLTATASPR